MQGGAKLRTGAYCVVREDAKLKRQRRSRPVSTASEKGGTPERNISRILSPRLAPRGDDHFSGTSVARGLKRPDPRTLGGPPFSPGTPENVLLFGLAPGGVCRAPLVTLGAVGSYPTVSPLPRDGTCHPEAVYFLWHFPSPCGASALRSTLPFGVRTFLSGKPERSSVPLWCAPAL